jgi:hypothetical protein
MSTEAFSMVINDLLKMMIRSPAPIQAPALVIEVLTLCLKTSNEGLCFEVTDRLLAPLNDPTQAHQSYLENTLVPLVIPFKQFTTANRITPSTEPYASFFKAVMIHWLGKVFGPQPPDTYAPSPEINNLRCNCTECEEIKAFYNSPREQVCSLQRIGAPRRKHVESQFAYNARNAGSCSMIRTVPQGVIVRSFINYPWCTSNLLMCMSYRSLNPSPCLIYKSGRTEKS